MTKDQLIILLASKRAAQVKFEELSHTDQSGMTDEQVFEHDIEKRRACAASVEADHAYTDALEEYAADRGGV